MSRGTVVRLLETAREEFCGMGTRKAKLRLNKLGKRCAVAKALRIALEIEDASTLGKKYRMSKWSNECYAKKHQYIQELIFLFRQQNWTFGKHKSDVPWTSFIIYFELPEAGAQVSWHCDLNLDVPDYAKEWDGLRNSTLSKIEVAAKALFDRSETDFFCHEQCQLELD